MRPLAPRELMHIRGLGAGVVMETGSQVKREGYRKRQSDCFKTLGLGNRD